jgi:hypothetical protein
MNPPRSAATSQWDDSNAARLLSQINKVRTHPAANPARPWYRGQIPDVPLCKFIAFDDNLKQSLRTYANILQGESKELNG